MASKSNSVAVKSGPCGRDAAKALGVVVVAALVSAVLLTPLATAAPVIQANVPDFYQHQKAGPSPWFSPGGGPPDPNPTPLIPNYTNGNWWERTGGWCRTTAWTDVMYHWSRKNPTFTNLYDHAGRGVDANGVNHAAGGLTWVDRFVFTHEDLATWGGTLQPCVQPSRVQDYARTQAPGRGLSVRWFKWDDTAGVANECMNDACTTTAATTYTSMFDLYYDLSRGGVVAGGRVPASPPLLQLRTPAAGTWNWWWNFHVVTGAGVDSVRGSRKLWFADPDNTSHGGGWGAPLLPTDPSPVGELYYGTATLAADGRTFNSGPYTGANVEAILVLAPEPGTMALLGLGLATLLVRRRPRVAITA